MHVLKHSDWLNFNELGRKLHVNIIMDDNCSSKDALCVVIFCCYIHLKFKVTTHYLTIIFPSFSTVATKGQNKNNNLKVD